MPKKSTLGQVQKLASQLSREDRFALFDYLAKLPDSGLIYHAPLPEPSSMVLPSNPAQEVLALNIQMGWALQSDGSHVFLVEDREVLRIKFNPDNYADFSFQCLKDKALHLNAAGEGHDWLRQRIRKDYTDKEGADLTEDQVDQIERQMLDWYAQELLKQSLAELAATIDKNINHAAMGMLSKIIQVAGFSVANRLRDSVGMPEKLKTSDVQSVVYKPEWDRLKTIVGLQAQGGARNVKHLWSDLELECLDKQYKQLQPIWKEAKQITRAAKNSQVASRRNNWRTEVLRAFPDLPVELLDRFQTPAGR